MKWNKERTVFVCMTLLAQLILIICQLAGILHLSAAMLFSPIWIALWLYVTAALFVYLFIKGL